MSNPDAPQTMNPNQLTTEETELLRLVAVTDIEDLKKARRYLDLEIARREADASSLAASEPSH